MKKTPLFYGGVDEILTANTLLEYFIKSRLHHKIIEDPGHTANILVQYGAAADHGAGWRDG